MNSQIVILQELNQSMEVLEAFTKSSDELEKIDHVAQLMSKAILSEKKIFSCGNGGSHCDAMHFAEELTGKYREARRALPAICISDSGHITCTGNDFGYDNIFSRYLEALGCSGDILLTISTSGASKNILQAAKVAKEKKMKIVALTGNDGGELASLADIEVRVPHVGYADRIQEIHIKIIHLIIFLIEKRLTHDL